MKKALAIIIAVLFSLFTTGLHVDLHTCMTEMSCHAEAEADSHDCCEDQGVSDMHNTCCSDTHFDYHLHDGAFVPADRESKDFSTPFTLIENCELDIEDTRAELSAESNNLIPDPGEPLYSLFHCRKLDC